MNLVITVNFHWFSLVLLFHWFHFEISKSSESSEFSLGFTVFTSFALSLVSLAIIIFGLCGLWMAMKVKSDHKFELLGFCFLCRLDFPPSKALIQMLPTFDEKFQHLMRKLR